MIKYKTDRTNRLIKSFKEPLAYSGCRNIECDYYMASAGNRCIMYPLDGKAKIMACPKNNKDQ